MAVPRITSFFPPNVSDTPRTLFVTKIVYGGSHMSFPRFVRISNPDEMLIFVDGACLNNGHPNATAGCAFVWHGIVSPQAIGIHSSRLEDEGPTGQLYQPTSNRAELRATIAALKFRAWGGEGWKRLVIATDSEYVALGATCWINEWTQNGWRTYNGDPVRNRDLWELLLDSISEHADRGLEVLFWRIPRSWNQVADREAKRGAEMPLVRHYREVYGNFC